MKEAVKLFLLVRGDGARMHSAGQVQELLRIDATVRADTEPRYAINRWKFRPQVSVVHGSGVWAQ